MLRQFRRMMRQKFRSQVSVDQLLQQLAIIYQKLDGDRRHPRMDRVGLEDAVRAPTVERRLAGRTVLPIDECEGHGHRLNTAGKPSEKALQRLEYRLQPGCTLLPAGAELRRLADNLVDRRHDREGGFRAQGRECNTTLGP